MLENVFTGKINCAEIFLKIQILVSLLIKFGLLMERSRREFAETLERPMQLAQSLQEPNHLAILRDRRSLQKMTNYSSAQCAPMKSDT